MPSFTNYWLRVEFKHVPRILAQPSVYFVRCYLLKDQAGIENVSQDLHATLSGNGQIINKEDYEMPDEVGRVSEELAGSSAG